MPTESGDRAIHDVGIDFANLSETDAETINCARQEILDYDVSVFDQVACLVESAIGGQIDCRRALVAVGSQK